MYKKNFVTLLTLQEVEALDSASLEHPARPLSFPGHRVLVLVSELQCRQMLSSAGVSRPKMQPRQ